MDKLEEKFQKVAGNQEAQNSISFTPSSYLSIVVRTMVLFPSAITISFNSSSTASSSS
jgi:hypothetical protein